MNVSDMPTYEEVLARGLENPEVRKEWERTAFARAVADRVVAYRTEHKLSQREFGKRVGLAQPAVARLESGDREPSLTTLARLASRLGIEFRIDITPAGVELREEQSAVAEAVNA